MGGLIGDGERSLVVVAKLREARELVCYRVREEEGEPQRRRWVDESQCLVVLSRDEEAQSWRLCLLKLRADQGWGDDNE